MLIKLIHIQIGNFSRLLNTLDEQGSLLEQKEELWVDIHNE